MQAGTALKLFVPKRSSATSSTGARTRICAESAGTPAQQQHPAAAADIVGLSNAATGATRLDIPPPDRPPMQATPRVHVHVECNSSRAFMHGDRRCFEQR